ncbi:hypothetical protein IU433_01785 [Nocardia puris]|nr:hypothetical protein [Nocardia puris]MBF6210517.1 hypothetical protein [Nocardia puris]MBF6369242.1 hypothetical protein [Nocardia puris]MBF6457777.1 hypothetical protein [Nocardia puris]
MKTPIAQRALVLAAAALAVSAPAAHGETAPHPTPHGPQAPADHAEGPANLDALAATVRPDRGTVAGVTVEFDRTSRTESGEKPSPATQFVFLFDRSIHLNPEAFPVCAREVIAADGIGACPPGSKVGEGHAEIYSQGEADVFVFNTIHADGGRGVLITIPATGAILANTFEPVAAPYDGEYAWGSDEILPSALPPSQRSATTRFRVSFGATHTDARGTHSFVESHALPGQQLRFGLWSRFVSGQTIVPTATTTRPLPW